MNCEGYRKKLGDALLRGEAVLGTALAGHVRTCADCAEFYEVQKRLLGAMDSSVRAMVNEETPASLLPRVRAKMQEVRIAGTWPVWMVPAGGVVVVALLISIPLLRRNFLQKRREAEVEIAEAQTRAESGAEQQASVVHSANPMQVARGTAAARNVRPGKEAPQVIILPAERAAFANIGSADPEIVKEMAATEAANLALTGRTEVAPAKIEEVTIPPIELENDK